MENSSELSREDYLDNVLEGMTVEGRLVCIPSGFKLNAIAGRASQVKDLGSWSRETIF